MTDFRTVFQQEYVEFVPSFDALTMFYGTAGNALVAIGDFEGGVVLLEHSQSGGNRWGPCNGTKLGRGMMTNCTDRPAKFRVALDAIGMAGFRVRTQDTTEMRPIRVEVTFGGQTAVHFLRAESKYVITEVPDIRDLAN